MPSAVLIFNTRSGSHLGRKEARREAIGRLEAAGISVTALDGPLIQQVRRSLKTPADMVVVGGGDGTIRTVIAAHRGRGRPVGIIPGGTMNLLARDYGVPEDTGEAVSVIAGGHTRAVDYALLGGHVFLHAALTGTPVRIGVHRENLRGRMGLLDALALAFHAVTTLGRDPVLTVRAEGRNGQRLQALAPTFALVVGTLEPQVLPRPRRTTVSSGLATLLAIRAGSGIDVARLLLKGALGDLADDPAVERHLVRSAEITGPRRRIHAMLDGESRLVRLPCAVEIRSGEVTVFAPAEVAGRDAA